MEKELWKYLKTAKKPIVLYGMGNGADKIINVLNGFGIEFHGVFASDGFVRDKSFHGHKISSYGELKEKFGDMIVLLCFGSERAEVIENVKRIAREQELYAPEVPVIGGGLFCEEYLKQNKERFEWVYSRLADRLSRKTFENIINYKLSGKIDYLFECEAEKAEPFEKILKLSNKETFLDLGAYNGDTVADFIGRVSDWEKIIAVEPDIKSFKKLALSTENMKNIDCKNVAISDFCGMGSFSMQGGRNSTASGNKNEVMFETIDSICENTPPTYIKMDLEGEELKAIKGAENVILNHKPKMLVSCYHRTDDLFAIPEAVFKIRDDYKLYMRHFSAVPAWDTNFYFV